MPKPPKKNDLRCRHPHLARSRKPQHRGTHRRRRMACDGKKALGNQSVLLGITWKPTPDGIFTRFHISDIWLDDASMQRAASTKPKRTKPSSAAAGCPRGSMPSSMASSAAPPSPRPCSAAWTTRSTPISKKMPRLMNAVENTLKHTHGAYGPAHMASKGPSWTSSSARRAPLGSSGIQIRFETDLIIEGIRPGRVVRVRPELAPSPSASRGIPQRQPRRALPDPSHLPEILMGVADQRFLVHSSFFVLRCPTRFRNWEPRTKNDELGT
jgi:hypothetical protein